MPSIAENLVGYYGIGSGSNAARRFNDTIEAGPGGWRKFVSRYVLPDIKQGMRRFMMWMPFGLEPANETFVDPYRPGGTYVTRLPFDAWQRGSPIFKDEGFVDAMKALTSDGIEIIAYTGMLMNLPTWKQQRYPNAEQWLWDCMEPFIEADCNMAFDTFCYQPDHSVEYELALRLKNMGIKVYGEAMPRRFGPNFDRCKWNKFNFVAAEADYVSSLSAGNHAPPQSFGYADPATIEGEILLGMGWAGFTAGATNFKTQYEVTSGARISVPDRIGQGRSCLIYSHHYREAGGNFANLIP